MSNLNDALRLLRKSEDMDVNKLAVILDVPTAYLISIEDGTVEPTSDIINKYAEYFKIDSSLILLFSDDSSFKTAKTAKSLKFILNLMKKIEKWGEL